MRHHVRLLNISLLLTLLLVTSMLVRSQSVSTFQGIRFEHPSNPGQYITLTPPSGISPYTLIWPASLPPGVRSLVVDGGTGNMLFGTIPTLSGTSPQVLFAGATNELAGSSAFTYDSVNASLQLQASGLAPALRITGAGSITQNDTLLSITSAGATSTNNLQNIGLLISSTGTLSGSNTRKTGLRVNVGGATNNYAAIFSGGRVGIGTSSPNTALDVVGDFALREVNYTTTLSATNNNVEFNTGNTLSFIRFGGTQGSTIPTVTGLAGGYSGKMVTIYNSSDTTLILAHESASSSAANRIRTFNSSPVIMPRGVFVQLVYSATDSRWIVYNLSDGGVEMYGSIVQTEVVASNGTLPNGNCNYLRVSTGTSQNNYDVYLADGATVGQILAVENIGPKKVSFVGTNFKVDGSFNGLAQNDAILLVWNGSQWVAVARQSNT